MEKLVYLLNFRWNYQLQNGRVEQRKSKPSKFGGRHVLWFGYIDQVSSFVQCVWWQRIEACGICCQINTMEPIETFHCGSAFREESFDQRREVFGRFSHRRNGVFDCNDGWCKRADLLEIGLRFDIGDTLIKARTKLVEWMIYVDWWSTSSRVFTERENVSVRENGIHFRQLIIQHESEQGGKNWKKC